MAEPIPTKDVTEPVQTHYVNLYESENKVYVRRINGFFQTIRHYTGIPLLLGFLLMPWLVIDQRPAMYFDLGLRQFHVLWMTFGPQDGMYLAWLLIMAAFALFTVTVLLGRVWCGFTCPQTVWTLMFIWAERVCEGDRNKRIKLDKQAWTFEKLVRKGGKHAIWVAIAFITGATFIGYFFPIRELLTGLIPVVGDDGYVTLGVPAAALFWTLFFAGMTYLNAGWMREQVCKYMCPYARFQAVMYDRDTIAVHYDAERGEQRGPRKSNENYAEQGFGDCIDCSWCVQVCPVDIDIRDGLQYECINCGLCVDACNSVMDKMGYARGLVRFTSEDALATGHTNFLRPRLYGYCFAVVAMFGLFVYAISGREPLAIDVARDRTANMYRMEQGNVVNVYSIKINNMDNSEHYYEISVVGGGPYELTHKPVYLEQGEIFSVPVRVKIPASAVVSEQEDIIIEVVSLEDTSIRSSYKTTFIAPMPK